MKLKKNDPKKIKKIKKKFFKNIFFLMSLFIIISGLVIMIKGNDMHWAAFHNMDLGQNMMRMEIEFNTTLMDLCSDGELRTGDELYIMGVNYLFRSKWIIIIGTYLSVGGLVSMSNEIIKK